MKHNNLIYIKNNKLRRTLIHHHSNLPQDSNSRFPTLRRRDANPSPFPPPSGSNRGNCVRISDYAGDLDRLLLFFCRRPHFLPGVAVSISGGDRRNGDTGITESREALQRWRLPAAWFPALHLRLLPEGSFFQFYTCGFFFSVTPLLGFGFGVKRWSGWCFWSLTSLTVARRYLALNVLDYQLFGRLSKDLLAAHGVVLKKYACHNWN